MAADGVVEPRVVALADERDDDVVLVADAGPLARHPLHRGVGDLAHRHRVGEQDRRLEQPPLLHLRQARDLAGAVEHEAARDHAALEDVRVRDDRGDAGAHRPLAHLERTVARDERRVPDAHARHVGDRVQRAGREAADGEAEVAQPRPHHSGLGIGVGGSAPGATAGAGVLSAPLLWPLPLPLPARGRRPRRGSRPTWLGPGLGLGVGAGLGLRLRLAPRSWLRTCASFASRRFSRRRFRPPSRISPISVRYSMPAAGRDEAEVGVARREAGQRVDLDDVDVALRRHAQVDARDVAAVERGERLAAHALDRLQLRGRELRRALVGDVLLPLLLDLEVVDGARVRLVLEQDLHRRQHARAPIAEQADRELAPGDVLLDERRLAVALDELAHDRAQPLLVVDHRRRRAHALRRALLVRLDDERELQLRRQPLAPGLHHLELGGQDAVLQEHPLRQRLVERDGQRRRVRAGVGDAEQLAQRRHRRLAVAARDALGDVEDQIDRRLHQLPRQLGVASNSVTCAVALERLADRVDGLGRVVLGLGVVAAPSGRRA